jgi:L-iditol 2-dehydrogenase
MRVAVQVGAGAIRLEERETPRAGPGDLLVRVRGCGLCGSDLAKLRRADRAPQVLGHEVVGDVVAIGAGAAGFDLGDRVVVAHHVPCFACHYCRRDSPSMCRAFKASNLEPGGFAEYVRVPPDNVRYATFRVPTEMPDAVAAFTEPVACCLRAIRRAGVGRGDTVVVVGLGAIGCVLGQLAAWSGAQVLGTDVLEERRTLAGRYGGVTALAPERVGEALGRLTEGRRADCVLLTVGAPAVVREAFAWVRDGGQVHLFVGEGEGTLPIGEIYDRELTLTATYSSSPRDLAAAFRLLGTGEVRVEALATHRVPLGRLAEASTLMERRLALKVYVEVAS